MRRSLAGRFALHSVPARRRFPTAKTVAIIGAGVAGLSAGIFAQFSGLSTQVFEMHSAPGGLCTAWKRKDYWFDGCIRYVYGSEPGEFFYPLMQQIGAAGVRPYIHHGEVTRVETSAGPTVVFYCDLDRLERHLLEVSPGDGRQIRSLTNAARTLSRAAMPVKAPSSAGELVTSAPAFVRFMSQFIRWGKVTLREVAAGFHSPALREAFTRYYGYADLTELPVFVLLLDLAQHSVGNAGWPQGGSRQLALDIERRYISLGGEVHYNCRVERILVEDGKAVGIRLADGQEHRAGAWLEISQLPHVL